MLAQSKGTVLCCFLCSCDFCVLLEFAGTRDSYCKYLVKIRLMSLMTQLRRRSRERMDGLEKTIRFDARCKLLRYSGVLTCLLATFPQYIVSLEIRKWHCNLAYRVYRIGQWVDQP